VRLFADDEHRLGQQAGVPEGVEPEGGTAEGGGSAPVPAVLPLHVCGAKDGEEPELSGGRGGHPGDELGAEGIPPSFGGWGGGVSDAGPAWVARLAPGGGAYWGPVGVSAAVFATAATGRAGLAPGE